MVELVRRLDVLVIGPGLGRNLNIGQMILDLLTELKGQEDPPWLILDADGLHLLKLNPLLLKGWSTPVLLTPNLNEMTKLCSTILVSEIVLYFPFLSF